ncbi:hypothetical protein AB6D04_14520 [Vibrio splendidus]
MEDILELSKSPAFWFSSVVIAFIMSLFASYAKDWIEDLKIKLSVKRKAKKENDEKYFLDKVDELNKNPILVSVYLSDIVFQKNRNVLYYIVTYSMMCFSMNNAVNDNLGGALAFSVIALIVFAIPVQITGSKIRKMSSLVNATTQEDEEHFID